MFYWPGPLIGWEVMIQQGFWEGELIDKRQYVFFQLPTHDPLTEEPLNNVESLQPTVFF